MVISIMHQKISNSHCHQFHENCIPYDSKLEFRSQPSSLWPSKPEIYESAMTNLSEYILSAKQQ